MCHKGTVRALVSVLTLVGLSVAGTAQTAPDWRHVGGSSVDLRLAAPATGPVENVWFSSDGTTLYARTKSGKVFQTSNFDLWTPSVSAPEPPPMPAEPVVRMPENGLVRTVYSPSNPSRTYAIGRQLWRSEDGGRSWVSLTAYGTQAVIGFNQHGVAISPADPNRIVVGNDWGVWQSMDGGLSWTGLNGLLPNLSVRRILSTPNGTAGTRIQSDQLGVLELTPGAEVWSLNPSLLDPEPALAAKYAATIGAGQVTAVGAAGMFAYAGFADGSIWLSEDQGVSFHQVRPASGARVERIFVDPTFPQTALAVLSGKGPRVFRGTNFGTLWDSLDGNLPDTAVHSVTADRAAGALYVATDSGVYWARTDLEKPATNPVSWTALAGLPEAPATDVRLDLANVQLYVAMDGYGVYAAAAPHRQSSFRLVNTADFTTRAAAPGSLLTVLGGRVDSVRGGDLDYPVLGAADNESQVQVPFEATGPRVALSLQTAQGVLRRDIAVQPVSPAIMVGRDGTPMLWDADSGLPVDSRNTAHSNGRLQIWATGLGKVNPAWPAGQFAPLKDPPAVVANVKVLLDGSPVQVTKATLLPGYIGFYLIEVQLPSINNMGMSQLVVTADGQESNKVQVFIEP